MENETTDQEQREYQEHRELRQIIGLLEKSFRIARDASLTGSMEGGKEYVIQQYNAIVDNLSNRRVVTPGFFPPLQPDAAFDAVGVACAQLAEYLKAGIPDHREEREFEFRKGHGRRNVNIIGNVGDLKEIGEIIRESLPEWMRAAREKRKTREAEEEKPPTSAAWASAQEPIVAPPSSMESDLSGLRGGGPTPPPNPIQHRLSAVSDRMQDIAEQMGRGDLPPHDLSRLAQELAGLAREQGQLARQAAASGSRGVDAGAETGEPL